MHGCYYEIIYKKGKHDVVVGVFSRKYEEEGSVGDMAITEG
jgi:hypothetical protein